MCCDKSIPLSDLHIVMTEGGQTLKLHYRTLADWKALGGGVLYGALNLIKHLKVPSELPFQWTNIGKVASAVPFQRKKHEMPPRVPVHCTNFVPSKDPFHWTEFGNVLALFSSLLFSHQVSNLSVNCQHVMKNRREWNGLN